jgi:hypothetical protein
MASSIGGILSFELVWSTCCWMRFYSVFIDICHYTSNYAMATPFHTFPIYSSLSSTQLIQCSLEILHLSIILCVWCTTLLPNTRNTNKAKMQSCIPTRWLWNCFTATTCKINTSPKYKECKQIKNAIIYLQANKTYCSNTRPGRTPKEIYQ